MPGEIKIARFVGIEACKSIFSDRSTFVLRSPEHYRRLYEISRGKNAKGDRDEGSAEMPDGGASEFTSFVASCWTKLKGNEPTSGEWDIFKKEDQNVVAIVSSPSKICGFLNNSLETNRERINRRFPFYPVEYKAVNYEREHFDRSNSADVVPFRKKAQFAKENEYRFVLKYGQLPVIDSFIFCGGIDYMENCFANPGICKKQKEELREILLGAMAGYGDFSDKQMSDIITNANTL